MEAAFYEVTFCAAPNSVISKSTVYCLGEFQAIANVQRNFPKAVIISVKKR